MKSGMRIMPPLRTSATILFGSLLASLVSLAGPDPSSQNIPDYSETPRAKVPDDVKFRISDLFADRSAWNTEKNQVNALIATIPTVGKNWTSSPQSMLRLLDLMASINERCNRLYAYAKLQNDMDLSDSNFTAMIGEIQTMGVTIASQSTFINPDVIHLGEDKIHSYLKAEPQLARHRFDLLNTLRRKQHILPAAEADIVAQIGMFSNAPGKAAGLLSDVDLPSPEVTLSGNIKVNLNESNYLKYRVSKSQSDRKIVAETYWKNMRGFQSTYAALLDGEIQKQVALARIHHFDSALNNSLFDDDINPQVYHNLIRTVKGNLAPLHRLVRLKQKMLGLTHINYYDIAVPAAPAVSPSYRFDEAKQLVIDAMKPLGPEYAKPLTQAFTDRWLDIYPNQGKQGGAYSMGVFGIHPYVKLNYLGKYADVSTLAHELGHSMHSHFACASQPNTTAGYSTFIAEIASTFNENLLLQHMLKSGTDDRVKLALLENYLERMRGTIYAQTMLAEFELAIHQHVEQGNTLTAEWLNQTYLTLYRTYWGADQGIVTVDDTVAITWAAIPHLYRPYYVFQYVTGMVASTALANSVIHGGKPEAERYLNILRAGGSKFPLEILNDAGLDMTSPKPVQAALEQFDHLVAEMETLYARLPKQP